MSTGLSTTEDLRYPIGKFQPAEVAMTDEERRELINQIAETPQKLRAAVAGLNEQQLDTPYRPEGWTLRQVVHHLLDSNISAFMRFRFTLTEDQPTIQPYDQVKWAQLPDSGTAPIEMSITAMDGLHRRFAFMLRAMTPEQWLRMYRHPERGLMSLNTALRMYAWHGRHHVAHITQLRKRMGW